VSRGRSATELFVLCAAAPTVASYSREIRVKCFITGGKAEASGEDLNIRYG
jgi:hypothetical protein